MDWLTLLGVFGLGSVVTAVVQSGLSSIRRNEERSFSERKEAYVGLLQAYHHAAADGTNKTGEDFAYWQMRCEIVAPEKVRTAIEDVIASNYDKKGRSRAHENLKSVMRADLGIR